VFTSDRHSLDRMPALFHALIAWLAATPRTVQAVFATIETGDPRDLVAHYYRRRFFQELRLIDLFLCG
jgi:hypothetical protein